MNLTELRAMKCTPMKGAEHALSSARVYEFLPQLPGWQLGAGNSDLRKNFKFSDFASALAFVNALGWIAERENHHPDLELGWGRCQVRFSTHDVGGISMNDIICAAKTEALLST